MQPSSCIGWILRADDRDAEIGDREQGSADRVRVSRAGVDVWAFDEQEREHRCVPNATYLRPEPPAAERTVEVSHRLSLYKRASRDPVIAGAQRLDDDPCAEALKARRDAAALFEDVGDYDRRQTVIHAL